MPLLMLLVLYLACLPTAWSRPAGLARNGSGVAWASAGSWALVLLAVAAAAAIASWVRRGLILDPQNRDAIVRRYSSLRFYHLIYLLSAYLVSLYFFGWGWAVQMLCVIPWNGGRLLAPGAELVLLLPLIVGLLLSWMCFYGAERALCDTAPPGAGSRPFWGRAGYVGFHLRQNLAMVLVPIVLLVGTKGLSRVWPELFEHPWFQGVSFLALLVLIGVLPFVLRVLLDFRPMPAGPLRDRLLAVSKRLNFRCSDIMLWNTRNGVANALVVGVVPMLRYVVLSDRLVADMDEDEVDAVFGHEAGHVKHHHMLYYLFFLFVSLAVLASGFEFIRPHVAETFGLDPHGESWIAPALVGSLGAYIFVVFGFLSRRCERQADIHGCRAVSCGRADCAGHEDVTLPARADGLCRTGIRTFIGALEKVAALNGMNRARPGWLQSWQHSTIARRVRFLEQMETDPTLEPRFQRRVGLVKWGLMIGLALLLGLMHWADPNREADAPRPAASAQAATN